MRSKKRSKLEVKNDGKKMVQNVGPKPGPKLMVQNLVKFKVLALIIILSDNY